MSSTSIKRKPGRPRLHPGERKETTPINTRVSLEIFDRLAEKAGQNDTTISSFVRQIIEKHLDSG